MSISCIRNQAACNFARQMCAKYPADDTDSDTAKAGPAARNTKALDVMAFCKKHMHSDARLQTSFAIENRSATRTATNPYMKPFPNTPPTNAMTYTPWDQWMLNSWKKQGNLPPSNLVKVRFLHNDAYVPTEADIMSIPHCFYKGDVRIPLKNSQVAIIIAQLYAPNRSVEVRVVAKDTRTHPAPAAGSSAANAVNLDDPDETSGDDDDDANGAGPSNLAAGGAGGVCSGGSDEDHDDAGDDDDYVGGAPPQRRRFHKNRIEGRRLVCSAYNNTDGAQFRLLTAPVGLGKTSMGLIYAMGVGLLQFERLRNINRWQGSLGTNGCQTALDPAGTEILPICIFSAPINIKSQAINEAVGCAKAWSMELNRTVDIFPSSLDTIAATNVFQTIMRRAEQARDANGCLVYIVTNDTLAAAIAGLRRQKTRSGKSPLPLCLVVDEVGGGLTHLPYHPILRILGMTATQMSIAESFSASQNMLKMFFGNLHSWQARDENKRSFEQAFRDNREAAAMAIVEANARFVAQDVSAPFIAPLISEMRTANARGIVHINVVANANPIIATLHSDPTHRVGLNDLLKLMGRKPADADAGAAADATPVNTFLTDLKKYHEEGANNLNRSATQTRQFELISTLVKRFEHDAITCPICFTEMTTEDDSEVDRLFLLGCCCGVVCGNCKVRTIDKTHQCFRCRAPVKSGTVSQLIVGDTPYEPPRVTTCTSFADLVEYAARADLSNLADGAQVVKTLLDEACAAGITQLVLAWNHGQDSMMGNELAKTKHTVVYLTALTDKTAHHYNAGKRVNTGTERAPETGRKLATGTMKRLAEFKGSATKGKMAVLVVKSSVFGDLQECMGVDLPGVGVIVHTGSYKKHADDQLTGRMLRPSADPNNYKKDKLIINVTNK